MFTKIQSSKSVSAATARTYQSQLNKIAKATEITTLAGLKEDPEKVIASINSATAIAEEGEKRNRLRRLAYSAIFWALHGDPLLAVEGNPYHKAFHDADPAVAKGGKAWEKTYSFTE